MKQYPARIEHSHIVISRQLTLLQIDFIFILYEITIITEGLSVYVT